MVTLTIHPHATRHSELSRFSHFDGNWKDLCDLVLANWEKRKLGNRGGVFLVPVPARGFYTSIVPIEKGMKVHLRREARGDTEEEVDVKTVAGKKVPARYVEIICYSAAALAEDNDRSGNADFEVVSINASPTDEPTPQSPTSMARNSLHLNGGTETHYTDAQWAEAVWFWDHHAHIEPEKPSLENVQPWVVIAGSVTSGFTLHGPFSSEKNARGWAEQIADTWAVQQVRHDQFVENIEEGLWK